MIAYNSSAGQINFDTLANLACVEQFYASQFVLFAGQMPISGIKCFLDGGQFGLRTRTLRKLF